MEFASDTVDGLLRDVLKELLARPFNIQATRGNTSEIFGVLLQLKNPRARLSRTESKGKIFGAFGEVLWYLSKDNSLEFIQYYLSRYSEESDDGKTIHGAYGPRLFNMRGEHDQVANVIKLLTHKPNSRRAVMQLFNAEDIAAHYAEIPCTCTLQFAIRDKKLNMYVSMRSNDAFWGLPHDIFSFTFLQEIIARELGIELGTYHHAVASLHLYEDMHDNARAYLEEGFQSDMDMPPMPIEKTNDSIQIVLDNERAIRLGTGNVKWPENLDVYWVDIIHLLEIFSVLKNNKISEANKIPLIKSYMLKISSKVYHAYIDDKLLALEMKEQDSKK